MLRRSWEDVLVWVGGGEGKGRSAENVGTERVYNRDVAVILCTREICGRRVLEGGPR